MQSNVVTEEEWNSRQAGSDHFRQRSEASRYRYPLLLSRASRFFEVLILRTALTLVWPLASEFSLLRGDPLFEFVCTRGRQGLVLCFLRVTIMNRQFKRRKCA